SSPVPPPSPDSCVRLWLARRRSRNYGCPPDSCRSSRGEPAFHPWWRKWNRDRWSTPDLAYGRVLPRGSALAVPSDTDEGCDEPGLLPPTARVERRSPSPHWLPRKCHPPIAACPVPGPLLYTAARSAQTAVQTASIPETVRVGSWRTWNGAGSLDRSRDQ